MPQKRPGSHALQHNDSGKLAVSLCLANKHELLARLKSDLRRILEDKNDWEHRLKVLLRLIDENLEAEKEWRLFFEMYEGMHSGFTAMLAGLNPGLTPTERKVCILVHAQLPSKEIARILCIEVRSVEMYRMRIRKKLNIPRHIPLGTFLTNYSVDDDVSRV